MLKTSNIQHLTATRGQPARMNKRLNDAKSSTLLTLFVCTGQGKNTYTQASINKILELLSEFHKIDIKRRWLFQCLRDLEDYGYISRRKRYLQRDGGLIAQIPSLWSFTFKGSRWLVSKTVDKAKRLYKNILSHLKKKDGRFPTAKDFNAPQVDPTGRKDTERLKHLAASVAKDMP